MVKALADDFKQRLRYITFVLVTHYGGKSDYKASGESSSHELNFPVGTVQPAVDRFLVVRPPALTTLIENGPPRESTNLISKRYDASNLGASQTEQFPTNLLASLSET